MGKLDGKVALVTGGSGKRSPDGATASSPSRNPGLSLNIAATPSRISLRSIRATSLCVARCEGGHVGPPRLRPRAH
jgi:hypothetical protein